jgi:hypothetical protein
MHHSFFSRGAFGHNGSIALYTDASFNSCSETGRSHSGWVVTVNDQPMLWSSQRQTLVTTSSTYAEVVACSDGIKDLMYVRDIISEFSEVEYPMIVHQDNIATIRILDNPVNNGITKYIAVKYFGSESSSKITRLNSSTSVVLLTPRISSPNHWEVKHSTLDDRDSWVTPTSAQPITS